MVKKGLVFLMVMFMAFMAGCKRNIPEVEFQTETTTSDMIHIFEEPYWVNVNVWVPEEMVNLTKRNVDEFLAKNTQYTSDIYTVEVHAATMEESVNEIVTEIECGPDLYYFNAKDFESVVNVGGVYNLSDSEYEDYIMESNYLDAVIAALNGGETRAFPASYDDTTGEVILLGVKPQMEQGAAIFCLELAKYLTSAESQKEIYEKVGWKPSNIEVEE